MTGRGPRTAVLLAVALAGFPAWARSLAAQEPMLPAGEEAEVPHPFFTHMGLPEGVGVFNLRLAGLATRAEGETEGDFAFHLETGLTRAIGLHIRNDRFLDVPRTEVMFQFAAITSRDGMSGIAPIIEFEVPTRSGGGSRINTLVGFTSTLANSRVAFNQALHYDPREDAIDASAAFAFQVGKRFFPVIEVLGEDGPGASAIINLLGGVKMRLREGSRSASPTRPRSPATRTSQGSSQASWSPTGVGDGEVHAEGRRRRRFPHACG